METVQNLSYCVKLCFAVTVISSVIMETHSAATKASSKTKEKKTKAHATPKCSGKKETAGTVINTKGVPEVKDKAEAKVAVVAKIAVDSVMVSVAKSAVEPSMVKDTEKEKANAKKTLALILSIPMPFQVITKMFLSLSLILMQRMPKMPLLLPTIPK
jgi:hypothetical protein